MNKKMQNTNGYKLAVELLTNGIVHPVKVYGTGKRTSYIDYSEDIYKYINKNNVKEGNDAPRGGFYGKTLEIKDF